MFLDYIFKSKQNFAERRHISNDEVPDKSLEIQGSNYVKRESWKGLITLQNILTYRCTLFCNCG